MSRPLFVTPEILEQIEKVRAYAEANVEPLSSLVRRMNDSDGSRAPGSLHFKETTVIIPVDYRCCFTIEQQPKGNCRHLSVSVPAAGKVPHEQAVVEIARAFGFDDPNKNPCHFYLETAGDRRAVNVLQFVEGRRLFANLAKE